MNSTVTSMAAIGFVILLGTPDQGPFTFLEHGQAEAYANTAYAAHAYLDLGSAATLPAINFEIVGAFAGTVPNTPDGFDRSHDANFADIMKDFIGNPRYGVDPSMMPFIDDDSWNGYHTYCQAQSLIGSPMIDTQDQALTVIQRWAAITNAWVFWAGTRVKFVPLIDSSVTDGLVTYTPPLAPEYDLSYDDFVFDSTSPDQDPITFERSDPRDSYNRVEVDCLDRNNYYDSNPQYFEDLASFTDYGSLQSQIVSGASDICDPIVGQVIANLIGKRSMAVRNTYSFKLGYAYVLLEPGDVVTLTEPNMGLDRFPVRITDISEDDKGNLDVKAEEFPTGIGIPAVYATTSAIQNAGPDMYGDPGDVNPPMIIEPSPTVTAGQPQVWIGASGASPNWGGARVYISRDGVNYVQAGVIETPTLQGTLTADLPPHADPDTTDVLSVDTTMSQESISTAVSHADADAFTTALVINDEVLCYGAVSATGIYTSNLSYLRRGTYSTSPADHPSGSIMSRIDPSAVVKYTLPADWVGVTLYVKLTSFNNFGHGLQDISGVTAYTYTPVGIAYNIAPPTSATLTVGSIVQSDGTILLHMDTSWVGSIGPMVGSYEVQMSNDSGATWTASDVTTGPSATTWRLEPAVASTNYQARVRAISQSGLASSTWAMTAVVNSGALGAGVAVPSTPTTLVAVPGTNQIILTWSANPPSQGVISYKLYRATGLGQPFSAAVLLATVAGGTLTYTDSGLAGGSTWTYFLSSVNGSGESGHGSGVNATVTIPVFQNKFTPYYSLQARKPAANEILFSIPIDFSVQFSANFSGSRGDVDGTAATAVVNLDVRKNGVSVGTVTYPSGTVGRNLATFSTAGGLIVSYVAGDELSVVAPASPDTGFQGFNFSLEGLR
jgi:hypothetical protein